MRRRNQNKKQVKIVIGSVVCLLLIMTIGYAAFSTKLTITAKGNVKNRTAAMQLKDKVVTTGDGIYLDTYENGRYVYRGSNPDNYITFNDELWRIVSVEKDGTLKIVRNLSIGGIAWDERTTETTGPRLNNKNTYCSLYASGYYYGCNVWMAIEGEYTDNYNVNNKGTVTENASLNNYLNINYYNKIIDKYKEKIINHNFSSGTILAPSAENVQTISETISAEKKQIFNGKVGLLNISDYLRSSTDDKCTSIYESRQAGQVCKNENYLYKGITPFWLLNSWATTRADVWVIGTNGALVGSGIDGTSSTVQYASTPHQVLPVLFLNSNISLSGSGSESNPYIIK